MLISEIDPTKLPAKPPTLENAAWGLTTAMLWFAVIFALIAIAIQVAKKFRTRNAGVNFDASEAMTNFRDLHSQGGLSDEEYKTIKKKLASTVKSELGEK
ncbi:hypothetical protein [Adhaeretor mobilis]|uniref:SHOCT domain-containing protein n=1 Tax=Adhaeretor mobilis TaxID=1930276 RepID=A0A517N0B3_9BACT|nr:hypothetical protein [Adhaeretor mobilis]QDT00575.1 hypothetical protein HG15A2_39130 [Adhaeretor mobilis]